MAVRSKVGLVKDGWMPGKPKKTRQGNGKNTKFAASSLSLIHISEPTRPY